MKYFYFVLIIFGLLIPYTQFVPFLKVHGMDLQLIIREMFSSRVSAFFALDLTISAIVIIPFMIHEGRKIRMKLYWIPAITVAGIGLSFGLPLFLFLREIHLEKYSASNVSNIE